MQISLFRSRFYFIAVLVYFFSTNSLHAYNLVTVLGITKDQKGLYIKRGSSEGITQGGFGVFSTDNLSLVAKAIQVSTNYSKWEVVEQGGQIPFQKDQVVTFDNSVEKVWMLDPKDYNKYQANKLEQIVLAQNREKIKQRTVFNRIVSLKSFYTREISTAISLVETTITDRSAREYEIGYGINFASGFELGLSGRYESEVTKALTVDTTTVRKYIIANLSYAFAPLTELPNMFLSLGTFVGLGSSRTKVATERLTGTAIIFPAMTVGLEYFFTEGYGVFLEGGVEAISVKESFDSDGTKQATTATNYRMGLGLRFYLD